ncbi:hypothetical protein [Nocardioides sp. 616]|uniref:divisome protein SepX/GlpR n=1 Tax=Nocardioides sp. 616 TaxID=2268090 RepID=UPI0013B3E874|nr:hypothetical protein [Nocardioides sp. 616]
MDLSALIFVAVAVAWAVYLIPKALKHHDEVQRSRSVDRFSATMRVLARREPVSRRDARLVVTPGRAASVPVIETKGPEPVVATVAARRAAANRAARRRRNVLSALLLLLVVVGAVAASGVISWWYVALPGALLAAWLVACRLMVTKERAVPVVRRAVTESSTEKTAGIPAVDAAINPVTDSSVSMDAVVATVPEVVATDPSMWDMIPVTLPTYVSKPAAVRRSVQTIDLDSTGVWTSGRSQADSALARSAEESQQAEAAAAEAERHRAVGS